MEKKKKQRLEAKGWKIGTVAEFLQLSPEEEEEIERKIEHFRKTGKAPLQDRDLDMDTDTPAWVDVERELEKD